MHVRRLRPDERDRALATIVTAFRGDPQVRWYFPDDDRYEPLARRFFGVLLDLRLSGGEVWQAQDGGGCAVALWNPPGGNLIGPEAAAARYQGEVAALEGACAARVSAVDQAVDRLLPHEPHWYLGVLACDPQVRGRGLASAVLAPVFAAADRTRLPVVLETSTRQNVAFYTRRGFAVAGHAAVDGLQIRVMRREPAAPR